MAVNTALLVDYSWSDIAKAAKMAMMSAAIGGGQLIINGKTITRITIDDARKLCDLAQEMIALEDAGENGNGNVLVSWGGE